MIWLKENQNLVGYVPVLKKEYTEENIPITPFNRDKSGIENLIKYKSKFCFSMRNLVKHTWKREENMVKYKHF